MAIASQQILHQELLQQLERDVTNAWETYRNALFILEAERNNLATNELNFERTEELFKSGQLNYVEFRHARLNLLNASISFNTAKFDSKNLEFQLFQLSGDILDQQF
ncbi:MAG: outer membrane protein [Saprospiraceae bacterium]